jgi:D-alanine transaminase
MVVTYYKNQFCPSGSPQVPVEERGFNFGDGVYEVVRYFRQRGIGLDEHVQRLVESAEGIRLRLPYPPDELRTIMEHAVAKVSGDWVDVYLQVTRGEAPRRQPFPDAEPILALVAKPSPLVSTAQRQAGISVIFHPDERWLNCNLKTLNLLPNCLAKQAALDAGAFEAILVRDGRVTEGSTSNVFAVIDGIIRTAPADRFILNGITRRLVIQAAQSLGLEVRQEAFTPEMLTTRATEVFITSTTNDLLPVSHLDNHALPVASMGPVTAKLLHAFRVLTGIAED